MKPILHIINNANDSQAIEIISKQAKDNSYGVTAIFTQDTVSVPYIPDVRICALSEDAGDKNTQSDIKSGIELINYEDMLKLIFSVESVTVW